MVDWTPEKSRERIRILVLGDSGVGKTSLVHLICHGVELKRPRSTVGCCIEMMLHQSRSSPGKTCYVEFWDVGGSERFKESRQVFFGCSADGLLFVHDLSNAVSKRNLEKWKQEWQGSTFSAGDAQMNSMNQGLQDLLPCLTVGNKSDLVPGGGGGDMEVEAADYEGGCRGKAGSSSQEEEGLKMQVAAFVDRVMEGRDRVGYGGAGGALSMGHSPGSAPHQRKKAA